MDAYIYGAGAQGRVINDILIHQKKYLIKFIDDDKANWGKKINGTKVIGGYEKILKQDSSLFKVIIAFGDPRLRLSLAYKLKKNKIEFLNVIHPSAVIMDTVVMGEGNMVAANAVINSNTRIGNHAIINSGAIIEHDCILENAANISSGVLISGRVKIKAKAFFIKP